MKLTLPTVTNEDRELLKKLLPLECSSTLMPETIDHIADVGNTVTLQKGDSLIDFGMIDASFYILIEGLMRCWYWNGDKEETEFFSSIPTTFIDYHSTCSSQGSFYCYEACIESRLIKVSKRDYDKLIKESHDFAKWRLDICQHQIYFFEQKKRLQQGNAQQRYESFKRNLPDVMNKVPLRVIASYLHITPEHLSRLRKQNAN